MPAFAPYKSTYNVSQIHLEEKTRMNDDHKYDALRNTEGEEWDTQGDVRQQRRESTAWRRVNQCRWVLDTALLLVIVGLLLEKRWSSHSGSHSYELAGDITGFAPTFSQQIVTFSPNSTFAPDDASEFWSKETQHAWLSIVPEGLGYIAVPHPSQYNNLPHPIHDYPNHTVFTTSVTHQLHCLYAILESHNTMKLNLASPGAVPTEKMPWHVTHCFEYLRQAIMCAGDVALEGAATTFPADENGEDRGGSDGWDARHVCKDYGQVYEYLEKETINHYKWIA